MEITTTPKLGQLGQLIIGNILEMGTSSKGGITSKATYFRLDERHKTPLIGSKLITSSKDKVDFAVNVPAIIDESLLSFINDSTNEAQNAKTIEFLKDCFYATYKEMANAAYNNQSGVIKLELRDCVEFATAERTRTRRAISFSGEYFKLSQQALTIALITYAKQDRNIEMSVEMAAKTMVTLKLLLTVEALLPTERQLDTLAGIFSYLNGTDEVSIELSNNLGVIIEMKNRIYNEMSELLKSFN